jgi:pimeloyl-ACP methyl ester carboxylesterase
VTVLEPTTSTGHPWRAAVTCPTLAAWGSDGDVLSEAQARGMVETLPGGELVRVPGVGHAPALVEPAVVAALECFSPHPPGVPEKTRRSSRFSRYR